MTAAGQPGMRSRLDRSGGSASEQERTRWRTIAVQVLVSVLCWLIDHALGSASRSSAPFSAAPVSPLPWRLLVEAVVVGIFAIGWLAGATPRSVPLVFLVAFALTWIPARQRRWALPLACVLLAVAYPFYADTLFTIPIFGAFPDVASDRVVMMVFMMMAVGLNIVVGYAGLLDLGYVAFYAIGAYVRAGSPRSQFAGQVLEPASERELPGQLVPARNFIFGASV